MTGTAGTSAMRQSIRTATQGMTHVVIAEALDGKTADWLEFSQDNVHPSVGKKKRTPRLSRPLIFLGLLAGVLVGILALRAGVLFVSPVPPDGRSAQSPAASSQTAARNAVIAERQVPPSAATSQAKSITEGVEASVEAQALVRERQRADALARDLAAAREEIEARTALATGAALATEAVAPQLRQAQEGERE